MFQKPGVYLIKEDNSLVYVGMSGKNLYKTLYRHFEAWNHRQQEVVTYHNKLKRHKYSVRVVSCTAKQAEALEKALVIKHRPRDNENKFTQYSLNFSDKKVLDTYNDLKQIEEAPF